MCRSRLSIPVKCILVMMLFSLASCAEMTTAQRKSMYGAGLGAVVGAGIGQLAGGDTKATLIGAAAGSVIGGGAGYMYSQYLDNKEKQFRLALAENEHVQIIRVGDDMLRVVFLADTMFPIDSAILTPQAAQTLHEVSSILSQDQKFDGQCLIIGHTDSFGTEAHNQELSERRAKAVERLFILDGIPQQYLHAYGAGESEPIASNTTEHGRRQNRRVELQLIRK